MSKKHKMTIGEAEHILDWYSKLGNSYAQMRAEEDGPEVRTAREVVRKWRKKGKVKCPRN